MNSYGTQIMRLKPQNANDSQILVKGRKTVDFQRFDEGSNPSFSAKQKTVEFQGFPLILNGFSLFLVVL